MAAAPAADLKVPNMKTRYAAGFFMPEWLYVFTARQ
jgi:hypothetical protein